MNAPEQSSVTDKSSPWRARIMLVTIVLVFFLPVVAAIWLNTYAPHWQPFGYTNRGELVSPAVQADTSVLQAKGGVAAIGPWLNGHWALIYQAEGHCGEDCEKALLRMHKVWKALGKDQNRVRQLLIEVNAEQGIEQHTRQSALMFPDLKVAQPSGVDPFSGIDRKDSGSIWLMDPRSFIILRFNAMLTPSEILKDLQHLLKLAKRD